ncbi:MobF family relaxase [Janibacter alittae]|uniref:MobF family relaxase n=1 Tax=Janibacter alittae TaxID=3115209 RepID=A0ABZ2MLF0_9MICO
MSMHKLTAGSGYDYLTRQVAAHDSTEKGHTGLSSYYTERGEAPGTWIGSGVRGIDGLEAGSVVTAEQMQALFGSGHHPLAQERQNRLAGPDLTARDYRDAARLGMPYKVYSNDVSPFRMEVAQRLGDWNEDRGHPRDWAVPVDDRARIRTQVASEFFRSEHGRDPDDAREIAATIAKSSRPRTTAVAGYDLTFSPVKSVSALWAVADLQTAALIEQAHQAAVKDTLRFIEEHALYTRTGTNGVRQLEVRGLVATAFTHRDSRAGDPDLHTHVAVANKVQTEDGRWLSIDGRVLYKANVTASETYNTALEKHLGDSLGLQFAKRPATDARKRPVREVVGVDPRLNERWSARRASIEARRSELAHQFQRSHGRPPTPVESIRLAQKATLETREAKKQPRSLAEQRLLWHGQANEVLGGRPKVELMIRGALHPSAGRGERVSKTWISHTSASILSTIESRRSTWQVWHVRAEAQRRVRGANVATHDVDRVVDRLVARVLTKESVRLAHSDDGIAQPAQLRRRDQQSVYTVHGADRYSSVRVMSAEQRIVDAAGLRDGRTATAGAVDLALLESTANGITLNAGQSALVRGMATSGARLQLAIAPAGAGKTTAMRTLSSAWANSGGTVLGLAPSAAAAAALREQIDTSADTLAKLTWGIEHDDLPQWAHAIGPETLVVIDEAGMADTLSLDSAVQFILERGANVRLIGDDQQLAAIGAGGVLRDIDASHGSLRLSELMRFADPAEGAASLALREGRVEALGFYLDNGRAHVGDLATMTEDVFAGWQTDRSRGLDAIMLAPTRELVAELNQRARADRLEGASPGRQVTLSDGLSASIGDLIITRSNDRRVRMSDTDWVKNGDRWTILDVHDDGAVSAQHAQNGLSVTLRADYVAQSTELGYATTIHAAQGVSVDAMHGLATGEESRQQIYTMLTRGRLSNEIYLEVVGDGDQHNVIRPDNIVAPTATDILEGILARDDSPVSATTQSRLDAQPETRLGDAATRYIDALYVAAEERMGPRVQTLDGDAERIVEGITDQPAWPALRAHLILLDAQGADPIKRLETAATGRALTTAYDAAAVLDWRLDGTGLRNASTGPLPWVPAVPDSLKQDPTWGPYLEARAELLSSLADQVRENARTQTRAPEWARQGTARPADDVLGEVQVWRAAMQVPSKDRRPTGAPTMQKAQATWQRHLNAAITKDRQPALKEWGGFLQQFSPDMSRDPFLPLLAERVAAMSRAGLPTRDLVHSAAAIGKLPDDHAAGAMWWRLSRHTSDSAVDEAPVSDALAPKWLPSLTDMVGAERANAMQASSSWPSLVTAVEHSRERGMPLPDVMATAARPDADLDESMAMIWRLAVLADPPPHPDEESPPHPEDEPPEDLWHGTTPPADAPTQHEWRYGPARGEGEGNGPAGVPETSPSADVLDIETGLQMAAMHREVMGPLGPNDTDIEAMVKRSVEWDDCPASPERMLQINALTRAYFEDHFAGSWAHDYLTDRFGVDLAGDLEVAPGYALAGWTNLVDHLRSHGISDQEMTATGVATVASTGRLIDRFRDRAILPITDRGEVLGFVGRRHPSLAEEDKAGPKYLNTADTPLFHKGAQLYGLHPRLSGSGATPVLVEGPMDAIAVTLASGGTHVGVAPLGTSLTEEQATQLAALGQTPIVATDGDLAGRVAAERDFWLLAQHNLSPDVARFPEGSDPADVLARRGETALMATLESAHPLAEVLLEERLTNLTGPAAMDQAVRVAAAHSPSAWDTSARLISDRLALAEPALRGALAKEALAWNCDPRKVAQEQLDGVRDVRARMEGSDAAPPAHQWAGLAQELDPRLTAQGDWPALAAMIHQADVDGHDITTIASQLVADQPLGDRPAQDLRYRLAATIPADAPSPPEPRDREVASGAQHERRNPTSRPAPSSAPRR